MIEIFWSPAFAPRCITAPLPNCFSIPATALATAFSFSDTLLISTGSPSLSARGVRAATAGAEQCACPGGAPSAGQHGAGGNVAVRRPRVRDGGAAPRRSAGSREELARSARGRVQHPLALLPGRGGG